MTDVRPIPTDVRPIPTDVRPIPTDVRPIPTDVRPDLRERPTPFQYPLIQEYPQRQNRSDTR
ncbi:MAG: hypothetical protein RH949_31185 [Coleofasciculus sp. A1-SPW-01]|uniref:hypothetical protein n=1 Tax=Coleofasciculus sp. A1-SPW-01 TaxID=3070819 RepID=UPI0032FA8052